MYIIRQNLPLGRCYAKRVVSLSLSSLRPSINIDNNNDNDIDIKKTTTIPSSSSTTPLTPEEFRKLHQITLNGKDSIDTFHPILSFDTTPFAPELKKVLLSEGFSSPTPTQSQSWPILLQSKDVISIARTGSGKTCAFLLPALQRILNNKVQNNTSSFRDSKFKRRLSGTPPSVLILAPTRELSMQIEKEAYKFAKVAGISTACIYGGASKSEQIRTLRNGVDIVVGTPGRVNDLIDMGALDISKVFYFVLDEADRMLDMGFEPQIRQVVETIPKERQTLFFTATWPKEIQALAAEFLTNPIRISIGESGTLNANKAITQNVKIISESQKPDELLKALQETLDASGTTNKATINKSIVFVARKDMCEDLTYSLRDQGYRVDCLHGDKSQGARDNCMDSFRRGNIRILVATDVAARGLDVKDVSVVINYDFPAGKGGIEDYVHRIGRTARGNNTGTSYSFLTYKDRDRADELIGILKRSEQKIPPELLALSKKNTSSPRTFGKARNFSRDNYSRDGFSKGNKDFNNFSNDSRRSPRGDRGDRGDRDFGQSFTKRSSDSNRYEDKFDNKSKFDRYDSDRSPSYRKKY